MAAADGDPGCHCHCFIFLLKEKGPAIYITSQMAYTNHPFLSNNIPAGTKAA
jgi:hypothetical protein